MHEAPGASDDEPTVLGRPMRAKDVKRYPRRHEVLETLHFIMQHDERIDLQTISDANAAHSPSANRPSTPTT